MFHATHGHLTSFFSNSYYDNWVEVIYFMFAPNDSRFTSSNKEKVVLFINRKQGEDYHMRPVKTRHIGFSVIVTTAVRAREVYISRGLRRKRRISCVWARHRDTMFERETDWQIKIRSSCWGWGGGEGEKDVSRVCAVGTEAQLASVCAWVWKRSW